MIQLSWYVWVAVGLILMGLEIIIPGFIIFWFGAGALLTALLTGIGLLSSGAAQWIVFFLSSLAFLALWFLGLKKMFVSPALADDRDPTLTNIKGKVIQRIEPNVPGRVKLYDFYHGVQEWKAESKETIEMGEEVTVLEAEGINLIVKKNS